MNGPLIAGICLLSRQDLVGRSKVGAAASARVVELQHSSQTEFDGEKAHLEARASALRAKRPTSAAMQAQMQAQAQTLNQQAQQMQERAAVRSRQLEATHSLAVNQVLAAAQPFVEQAYAAHNCGLLLDKDVALGGNLGNDLTPEAIAAMDAKAAPITVELVPASSVGR
jgi:Skp family chaperone for outer membrane proteins